MINYQEIKELAENGGNDFYEQVTPKAVLSLIEEIYTSNFELLRRLAAISNRSYEDSITTQTLEYILGQAVLNRKPTTTIWERLEEVEKHVGILVK